MKVERFEDLICWQKAKSLTIFIYSLFKSNKDFGFRDQILRAVVSIMNNIAEGFERYSNKELKNFLFIAKGSCGEVRSMLYIALALGYINQVDYEKANSQCLEVSRLIGGFIKTLQPSTL
jgi:four helix bundle protein